MDVDRGIVYNVQNIPSWQEVYLKSTLENHFQTPVYVNNDANCFTVGIKYFGEAKEYKNIVGLTLGTGMGAGIIANDLLYSGSNCGAGEFGMLSYLDHNYEYYCSGQFFIREYGISADVLFKQATQGDKNALDIFNIFGKHLGNAINAILFSVDPDIIILGGSISKAWPFFENSMQAEVEKFEYSHVISKIKIKVNQIPNIALLGAAALYLNIKKLKLNEETVQF